MATNVYRTHAKAAVGGMKVSASSDDIRRIEVRVIHDDVPSERTSMDESSRTESNNNNNNEQQQDAHPPKDTSIGSKVRTIPIKYVTNSGSSKNNIKTTRSAMKKPAVSPTLQRNFETPIMQQYNKINHKMSKMNLGGTGRSNFYNSKYMRGKYARQNSDEWETQSQITPILEDPNMPFGSNLYKQMKETLKAYRPKLMKANPPQTQEKRTLASGNHSRSAYLSSRSSIPSESSIFECAEREDDECSVTINVLDGKTVRVKSTQGNTDGQYLTGYQHSSHINPKYRFMERTSEDADQMFLVEHLSGNKCVLLSAVKHLGYIKPALYYSPVTQELQLRDFYPYCPKERGRYFCGNSKQQTYFMFECNDYKMFLPGFGMVDLELVSV